MADAPPPARQFALPFDEPDPFSADDFIDAPSNKAARAALGAPETWVNGRLVVWGDEGCGKSHLVALWAADHSAPTRTASSLREPWEPRSFTLVIEDIDMTTSPTALFGTLEHAARRRQKVLMTSRQPPGRLPITLADLGSRLRASLTIPIGPAEPELLDGLLFRLAAKRQLILSPTLHQFLLARLPRRPGILREAVARLDRYALALGTAPSRRIAERLLAELTDLPDDAQIATREDKTGEDHETDMNTLL